MADKFMMHIPKWQEGTEAMSLELEGFYLRIVNILYLQDGVVADDDNLMAHKTFTSKRKYKALKNALIEAGKLKVIDGLIVNEKTSKELDFINEKSAKNSRNSHERWMKYNNKKPQKPAKSLNNNTTTDANAERTHCEAVSDCDAIPVNRGTGELYSVSTTEIIPEKPTPTRQSPSGRSQYSFEGHIIKLDFEDLEAWRKAFAVLPDLIAELQSRDDWLRGQPAADQKRWFNSTSSYLRNKCAAFAQAKKRGRALSESPDDWAGENDSEEF